MHFCSSNDDFQVLGFPKENTQNTLKLRAYDSVIKKIQNKVDICTKIPQSQERLKRILDINFVECYEEGLKMMSNVHLIMDNDSGYVSHSLDTESNNDSLLNNSTSTVDILKSFLPQPIFLSEDALLERPDININNINLNLAMGNENYEESRELFFESPSHISASIPSTKTEFSGFETDAEGSDSSFTIPVANAVYFDLTKSYNSNHKSITENETYNNFSQYSEMFPVQSEELKHVSTVENWKLNYLNSTDAKTASLCVNDVQNLSHSLITEYKEKELPLNEISNISKIPKTLNNVIKQFDINNLKENSLKDTVKSKDKENISQRVIIVKTPIKVYRVPADLELSPDIFDDEECDTSKKEEYASKELSEQYITKEDNKLLKKIQTSLNGVPPPPSLTVVSFSVEEMLGKIKENANYFWDCKDETENDKQVGNVSLNCSNESVSYSKSLLVNREFGDFTRSMFPDILNSRHHGLHHNRSKVSEEIEHLCDKFARRYVGGETQSTCVAVEMKMTSPMKRKMIKSKWTTKSPGRRLSHLARRRITFSSANLQAGIASSGTSRSRQILVDCKKMELLNRKKSPRKTPKKTPGKSPVKRRTPSSSAKKKLRMRFRLLSGDFKETQSQSQPSASTSFTLGSKRALFQSPDKALFSGSSGLSSSFSSSSLGRRNLFSSPAKSASRRSLFLSPTKRKSPNGFEKKRKRSESDDVASNPATKFSRSVSTTEMRLSTSSDGASVGGGAGGGLFNRSQSEILPSANSTDLSAMHKKKLQWAVYEALKTQNITSNHPQFKVYASVLARVTRRFILASNAPKQDCGTSERMLRIARHNVYFVVKGHSVEEIIANYNRQRARFAKPQGYVSVEEYNTQKSAAILDKENVLRQRGGVSALPKSTDEKKHEGKSTKPESRIDRIRKVINFEENR